MKGEVSKLYHKHNLLLLTIYRLSIREEERFMQFYCILEIVIISSLHLSTAWPFNLENERAERARYHHDARNDL